MYLVHTPRRCRLASLSSLQQHKLAETALQAKLLLIYIRLGTYTYNSLHVCSLVGLRTPTTAAIPIYLYLCRTGAGTYVQVGILTVCMCVYVLHVSYHHNHYLTKLLLPPPPPLQWSLIL